METLSTAFLQMKNNPEQAFSREQRTVQQSGGQEQITPLNTTKQPECHEQIFPLNTIKQSESNVKEMLANIMKQAEFHDKIIPPHIAKQAECHKEKSPSNTVQQVECHKEEIPLNTVLQTECHKEEILSNTVKQAECHEEEILSNTVQQAECHKEEISSNTVPPVECHEKEIPSNTVKQADCNEKEVVLNTMQQYEYFKEDISTKKTNTEKVQSILNDMEHFSNRKGRVSRCSGFKDLVVDTFKKFFEVQDKYGFNKYDAQRLLINSCGALKLTFSQVKVLNVLIQLTKFPDWFEDRTPICTATNKTIASRANLSQKTVPKVLRNLEANGFIIRNYDRETNQRTGEEPISLAPYIAMLPDLADEVLLAWVVEKRAKQCGRQVNSNDVIVTRADKQAQAKEQQEGTYYMITEDDFTQLEEEVELLETQEGSNDLWDYCDQVVMRGKISDKDIVQSVKKRSIKEVVMGCIADLSKKVPEFNPRMLGVTLKKLISKKRGHELPLYIMYSMYLADSDNACKYLGYLCSKLVFIKKNIQLNYEKLKEFRPVITRNFPSIKTLKVLYSSYNFDKYDILLQLIKKIGWSYKSLLKDIKLRNNILVTRDSFVYQRINQCININNLDLQVVKE